MINQIHDGVDDVLESASDAVRLQHGDDICNSLNAAGSTATDCNVVPRRYDNDLCIYDVRCQMSDVRCQMSLNSVILKSSQLMPESKLRRLEGTNSLMT